VDRCSEGSLKGPQECLPGRLVSPPISGTRPSSDLADGVAQADVACTTACHRPQSAGWLPEPFPNRRGRRTVGRHRDRHPHGAETRGPGDSWEAGLQKIAKQIGVRTGTVQRIGSPRDVVLAWDLRRGCVE
jgi:hypothetical protein